MRPLNEYNLNDVHLFPRAGVGCTFFPIKILMSME